MIEFTGKERDAETGLDNFGARYNAGAQGRFTSPDPKSAGANLQNPQSWNGYAYALNNPLAYIDLNGKWPFYIHNMINAEAFGRILSPHQLAYLRDVNWNADYGKGAQDPSRAFTHSMCAPGQSAGESSGSINSFINERLNTANKLSSGGREITDKAIEAFGQGLQALEDMGSPAHVTSEGNPIPWGNGLREGMAHVWAERDEGVNWFRLGQSIRLGIAGFSQAFPALANREGSADAWAQRTIESYVHAYFLDTSHYGDHMAEDAARQCALGNPAACGR